MKIEVEVETVKCSRCGVEAVSVPEVILRVAGGGYRAQRFSTPEGWDDRVELCQKCAADWAKFVAPPPPAPAKVIPVQAASRVSSTPIAAQAPSPQRSVEPAAPKPQATTVEPAQVSAAAQAEAQVVRHVTQGAPRAVPAEPTWIAPPASVERRVTFQAPKEVRPSTTVLCAGPPQVAPSVVAAAPTVRQPVVSASPQSSSASRATSSPVPAQRSSTQVAVTPSAGAPPPAPHASDKVAVEAGYVEVDEGPGAA